MDERLLELYNLELRHLRETAAEFGPDFPKIAGRLALDLDAKEVYPDPYVERLLEGFAFLAARIHLKLDAEFPRFTQGLLETVYPDYLCPVPSMAIARFEPEEQEGSLAPGFVIKRGTVLRSQLKTSPAGPRLTLNLFTCRTNTFELPGCAGFMPASRLGCLYATLQSFRS